MDFNDSPAEEQFRAEVRTWLEANLPADLRQESDEQLTLDERWERHKA